MRPKTFPATTYSGNSRQRLQEIREGLKQPSKASTQGLLVGPNSDTSLDAKVLGSKDASRQQQMRATPKFGPYQKALREIRYSLLPFANESGTSAAAEVNRQMLQELVNAGCDQGRILRTATKLLKPQPALLQALIHLSTPVLSSVPLTWTVPACGEGKWSFPATQQSELQALQRTGSKTPSLMSTKLHGHLSPLYKTAVTG